MSGTGYVFLAQHSSKVGRVMTRFEPIKEKERLIRRLHADTSSMKALAYKLATSQIQFQYLWIIIGMSLCGRKSDRVHLADLLT